MKAIYLCCKQDKITANRPEDASQEFFRRHPDHKGPITTEFQSWVPEVVRQDRSQFKGLMLVGAGFANRRRAAACL